LPLISAYHEFESINLTEIDRKSSANKLIEDRNLGGIWTILSEDKLIGYIALCKGYSIEFGGLDAFVDEFYIQPEYRGKGIGTEVLELIKLEARKIEIRAIHLEVAHTNHKAKKLYSKAGFREREKYILMSVNL